MDVCEIKSDNTYRFIEYKQWAPMFTEHIIQITKKSSNKRHLKKKKTPSPIIIIYIYILLVIRRHKAEDGTTAKEIEIEMFCYGIRDLMHNFYKCTILITKFQIHMPLIFCNHEF